jgi:hypothetical protein
MTEPFELGTLREVITAAWPELSGARFRLAAAGWDSLAVDVDDRLIFKFPRSAKAEAALIREAGLLAVIRPCLAMAVPDLTLHAGPPLFSRHAKLLGDHLIRAAYERMGEAARERLAQELALLYAQLHTLDRRMMREAGAGPIGAWLSPEAVLSKAVPRLPEMLRGRAEAAITAWQDLAPDPHGETYGFFDGHGWNMAFDHARQQLNGIYDFADSGFGPLHQEFIYSSFIASELTERIVAAYERRTGRLLDRSRIAVLTGVLRLSELAEHADDPRHAPMMIRNVELWAAGR